MSLTHTKNSYRPVINFLYDARPEGIVEKRWRRVARAKVLLHLIDILHFDLFGRQPAPSHHNKRHQKIEIDTWRRRLLTDEGGYWCEDAGFPRRGKNGVFAILAITDKDQKMAMLELLDGAYKALVDSGMR